MLRREGTNRQKRVSLKPLIVLSVLLIGVAAGVAAYRQHNLSTGPKPSDMVTDGFYYGQIRSDVRSIVIQGSDTRERSYDIILDTSTNTWSGIVSYKENDAVVSEGISGDLTDEELTAIVATINRIDGKSTIQIDSDKEKTALVREAALPDSVKSDFEDFIEQFSQGKFSFDEYTTR